MNKNRNRTAIDIHAYKHPSPPLPSYLFFSREEGLMLPAGDKTAFGGNEVPTGCCGGVV